MAGCGRPEPVAAIVSPEARIKEVCIADMQVKVASFDRMVGTGDIDAALAGMFHCEPFVTDGAVKARLASAHVHQIVGIIESPAERMDRKRTVLEMLGEYDPTAQAAYRARWHEIEVKTEKSLAVLAQAEKQVAADRRKILDEAATAEAEIKRSRGVVLGMSREDVVQSSWGHPDGRNRTVTADGVSEQWVYGASRYLYFRNGVLVTIQD